MELFLEIYGFEQFSWVKLAAVVVALLWWWGALYLYVTRRKYRR